MKKTLSLLFLLLLFLLILFGAASWFSANPHALPDPLRPALSWFDQKHRLITDQFVVWRDRLSGKPPIVAADSAARTASSPASPELKTDAQGLARVTLDDQVVASVGVAADGSVEVTGNKLAGSDDKSTASSLRNADPRSALVLSDTDALIAQTDAAIARADAELAQILTGKQGGTSEPSAREQQTNPSGTTGTTDSRGEEVTTIAAATGSGLAKTGPALATGRSPTATRQLESIPPTANALPASGPGQLNAAPAAAAALPAEARSGVATSPALASLPPEQRRQVTAMLADPAAAERLPAGLIVAPDGPQPAAPVTVDGRMQQDTIRHFLSGQTVEFEVGRSVLTERGRRALLALLDIIEEHQGTIITVQGHTDSVGDGASNLALSTARAITAREFLVARGVDPQRLRVQGFGERRPVASNADAEGRIRNRRIDFAVSDR